ncbi:tectonic-3-like [Betta splendens]|uniref:Tectonic-3-like n=1 Tax=Betta splendens TaxID=158456 RepID=A0A6P7LB90_BETSP|nr:tectonic-3-like [Betta splendens]
MHLLHVFIVLCTSLADAATESGITSTVITGQTTWEPPSSATPSPAGPTTEAVDPTGAGAAGEAFTPDSTGAGAAGEALTPDPTGAGTVDPRAATPFNVSEPPPANGTLPAVTSQGCLCDLTPGLCDIGCCCDTVDCGVADLSTVFTGCQQKAVLGVCIEKWLMFRANVNSSLVTVTDSLFCVRAQGAALDSALQGLPATQYPVLGNSYHFSPPIRVNINHGRNFYRVDDVIQTHFSNSSVRSVLYQPSPGPASAFCINRNPAKFLRSVTLSCARVMTPRSCTTDPSFSARSYFLNMSLIKIPKAENEPVSDFLIPVAPLSEWPSPSLHNNSCKNVVTKVEFVIVYTSRGELVNAQVNVVLSDVDPNQLLAQTHSVRFQADRPDPSPKPIPPVGLTVGSPVVGRFNGEPITLTTLGVSQGGQCSTDPSRRAPILFAHNTFTGCTFSSPSSDCSELRSQVYGILQGLSTPDEMGMHSGSVMNWTRVITQDCPIKLQESCDSGCILPSSLSIRVLWARQGLLELPQNYILGAKYLFVCQTVKCPVSSPLVLTTEVIFADTTVYPERPRGLPRPNWKLPFDFFTRGTSELDGNIVSGGETVTWSLMLFTFTVIVLRSQLFCR